MNIPSAEKTPDYLRRALLEDLKKLRKRKITCRQAQSVARMSDSIMRTMCR